MAEEEVQQQMEGDEESVPVMVDRSKLTPNMRHYLQMSKLHSKNEYAKGPVGLYRSKFRGHIAKATELSHLKIERGPVSESLLTEVAP